MGATLPINELKSLGGFLVKKGNVGYKAVLRVNGKLFEAMGYTDKIAAKNVLGQYKWSFNLGLI